MLTTIRDRVKKQMDEGKALEQIIAADLLSGFVQKGPNANSIIKIVYNSILKSKK